MKERKKTPAKGKNSSDDFFFFVDPSQKKTNIYTYKSYNIHIPWKSGDSVVVFLSPTENSSRPPWCPSRHPWGFAKPPEHSFGAATPTRDKEPVVSHDTRLGCSINQWEFSKERLPVTMEDDREISHGCFLCSGLLPVSMIAKHLVILWCMFFLSMLSQPHILWFSLKYCQNVRIVQTKTQPRT